MRVIGRRCSSATMGDFFIVRDPDGHEIVFAVTEAERHSIDPW